MKRILVYGAGAIGRGFVPWIFPQPQFALSFVESDSRLREALQAASGYTSYQTRDGEYHPLEVPIEAVFAPGDETGSLAEFDGFVAAVGPRNFFGLESSLKRTEAPVLCLENDASLAAAMCERTGLDNVFFGIPDVITSQTAPEHLLRTDPLAIVTEDGVCFADCGAASLGGEIEYVLPEELERQWLAKLYIHNTPHCVAAYLGSIAGFEFLSQAMCDERIGKIVTGAMDEMKATGVERFGLDEAFCRWYRDKEIARFSNPLLFDPIARVAREPFRKLGLTNRLIGAAQLALACGIVPSELMVGIMAAFFYENPEDRDSHIACLRDALSPADFLEIIIGLRPNEVLYDMLIEDWERNSERLEAIRDA